MIKVLVLGLCLVAACNGIDGSTYHNADLVNARTWQVAFLDARFSARTTQPGAAQQPCDPGCECTFEAATDFNDVQGSESQYRETCASTGVDLFCVVFFEHDDSGHGDCGMTLTRL